ncbi:hypothetical protein [Curtobacterium sp. NPDC088465]|uniref:hypothetical protein n=1 Tax=Curtobacterium sp. NPDC088465 TaxID=3363967 RepID=UPI0037F2AB69
MQRRRSLPVLTASTAIGLGLALTLSACSGAEDPAPSGSATATRSASATPTPSGTATAPSGDATPTTPSDDQTGPIDDGTGPGTGNGSGVDQPESVDFGVVTEQGIAAAGGGTVVSLVGTGDNWTVVVAGPDGSQTQSVVSATLGRVTSGPFPKDADEATKAANVARAAAVRIDAVAAADRALGAVAGSSLTSLVLGGSGQPPVWTATVTAGGTTSTVTVDAVTGTTSAS